MSKIFIIMIVILNLMMINLHCQDMPLSVNQQFSIFIKIFSFNRTFGSSNRKNILVVYQRNYRTSYNIMDNIVSYFSGNRVTGNDEINKYQVSTFSINEISELKQYLSLNKIDIIYITPLRSISIEKISDIAIEKKALTITGIPDYMDDGISVGLDLVGEKPRILINLNSSKACGAEFSSQLLKLSKIISK